MKSQTEVRSMDASTKNLSLQLRRVRSSVRTSLTTGSNCQGPSGCSGQSCTSYTKSSSR